MNKFKSIWGITPEDCSPNPNNIVSLLNWQKFYSVTYSLKLHTFDFKEPYWGTPVASSASRLFTQRIRIIISFIK